MSYVSYKLVHLTLAVALPRRGRAHARALLIALPLLALAGGAVALFKYVRQSSASSLA